MAQNKFKIDSNKKRGLFARFEHLVRFDRLFEDGLPLTYLPNILFTTILVIIYIGYHHYAEKTTRDMNKIEVEVEDLRADYTTLKAEYMYSRLQSEVVKKVEHLGLQEASQPPNKIYIQEGEY